ncbi:MAG: hypothetical protein IJD38_08505 [Clostridia bacterium]|nr:hypothetical protein [Clostridia bacterium]
MKIQNKFEDIFFRGHFRDFQRQLLRRVDDLPDTHRLNLITAPGSDKKLLGLEIIRRMGGPTIIVTSSKIVGARWADRFRNDFLESPGLKPSEDYISFHLTAPALMTVVTYDTLTAAMERRRVSDREDNTPPDLIRMIRRSGIRTVCLDEPHHLAEAHMKSLETLLGILGREVRVLSLSSFPPYDLLPREWDRFIALCGEISEEIYTPELVQAGVLAPHQDYVYFNCPTDEESQIIREYRLRVDEAVAAAMKLDFMGELNRRVVKLYHKDPDFLYDHYDEMLSLLMLLAEYGYPVSRRVCRYMTRSSKMPPVTLRHTQRAFHFLLESLTLLHDGEKEELMEIFERHRITERGRIALTYPSVIRRTLTGSGGKLDSVATIIDHESLHLGELLRALIVTDEGEEDSPTVSDGHTPTSRVTPFTAFESVRLRCPRIPVGCMTQSAVILPDSARRALSQTYGMKEPDFSTSPIDDGGYARFTFRITPDSLRRLMTRLLDDGIIRVLVATDAALGEEWTMSCVNTLIPLCLTTASSAAIPRMRGIVLQTDKSHSEKTVHVWHPVTVEHPYSLKEYPSLRLAARLSDGDDSGNSPDYAALRRRFDCFIAPGEADGELESGYDRLDLPPKSPPLEDLAAINARSMASAADRSRLKSIWRNAMEENTRPVAEVILPKSVKVPVFTLCNAALLLIGLSALLFASLYAYVSVILLFITFVTADLFFYAVLLTVLVIIALLWGIYTMLYVSPWLIHHLFPRGSLRSLCSALLRALKEQGEISAKARFVMEVTPDKRHFRVYPDDCPAREQRVYRDALAEMLSPVKAPRFIMVRAGMLRGLRWRWSFACPTVIGQNDVSVKILERHLRRSLGRMKFRFTLRDPGRENLIIARNRSYLNDRRVRVEKRFHVPRRDRF